MKRSISIILCFILALGLLVGCGASAPMADMAMPAEPAAPAAPVEPVEAPMPEAEMYYGYAKDDNFATSTDVNESQTGLPANTKLIYKAWLELETTEFDSAIAGLEDIVDKMGGYFESSNLNNYGTYRSGNYTVRVPAANFDAFCGAVGELCQLNSIERSAQDVSEAYYDTESRLVTQQTKLERLQNLLAKAESMEDIITLETAISDTEYAIEQLTGTLRKYDSLVGYSTVSIYLNEVYELTEVEEPVIGFGAKLAEAFKRGSSNFVDSLERTMLRFARNWVGWIIWIIIIALVVFFVVRSARRKKAERSALRRAAKKEDKDSETDKK